MEPKDRICVALDVPTLEEAKQLAGELAEHVGYFKIGFELFTAVGPEVVRMIQESGGQVFLDLKYNDIPNTMAGAAKAASALGVAIFNVHASAGLQALRDTNANKGNSKVIAVTVLTSLDDEACLNIFGDDVLATVNGFARDAQDCSLDGVVCSPQELAMIRGDDYFDKEFLCVTPAIRPLWSVPSDQARPTTPADAIKAGSSILVIGRPITKPPAEIGSSVEAAKRIAEEIASAL